MKFGRKMDKPPAIKNLSTLAERKGFEPLSTFLPYTISSRAPSTNSAISPEHICLLFRPCRLTIRMVSINALP